MHPLARWGFLPVLFEVTWQQQQQPTGAVGNEAKKPALVTLLPKKTVQMFCFLVLSFTLEKL